MRGKIRRIAWSRADGIRGKVRWMIWSRARCDETGVSVVCSMCR